MRALTAILAIVLLSTAACRKTEDGKIEATTPTVDIDVGTRKDTLTPPTVTTKPETVVVQKPVIKPPPNE